MLVIVLCPTAEQREIRVAGSVAFYSLRSEEFGDPILTLILREEEFLPRSGSKHVF